MTGLHIAARAEDAINTFAADVLERRHWDLCVYPFVGYGSVDPTLEGADPFVRPKGVRTSTWSGASAAPRRRIPEGGFARILGRIVLSRNGQPAIPATSLDSPVRRGVSAFIAVPQPGRTVRIRLGDAEVTAKTDRGGYYDVDITGHNLTQGWHEATISCGGITATSPVQIIGGEVRFGVISDIDDTAIITALPRLFIAAWNTFVVRETARRAVPGMPALYRSLLAKYAGAPMFYVSTGAWNTQPVLSRFMKRRRYPTGTMLLTDWGPTETRWFRSGTEHKRRTLQRLAREFPNIKWILIGDDGQHDPLLYEEFALSHPGNVAVVAIRQLTPAQQVLSHGHPLQLDEVTGRVPGVPWVEGADGYDLHKKLTKVLGDA